LQNETKYLYIKAIATQDFKEHYGENWQKIIEKTIQDSSNIFEEEFAIKLIINTVEVQDCEHEYLPFSVFGYVNDLSSKEDAKKHDIIIAFTNAPAFSDGSQEFYGQPTALATIFYKHKLIVLANPEKTRSWRGFYEWKYYKNIDWISLKFLLVHELGHFFKARDVKDKKSYMFERMLTSNTNLFDKTNKKIILKNKWINYDKSAILPK